MEKVKKYYVVDSEVENDLIEYFDYDYNSEREVLMDYLDKMKSDKRFYRIEIVEDYVDAVVLDVDSIYGHTRVKVKVVEVPAKLDDEC